MAHYIYYLSFLPCVTIIIISLFYPVWQSLLSLPSTLCDNHYYLPLLPCVTIIIISPFYTVWQSLLSPSSTLCDNHYYLPLLPCVTIIIISPSTLCDNHYNLPLLPCVTIIIISPFYPVWQSLLSPPSTLCDNHYNLPLLPCVTIMWCLTPLSTIIIIAWRSVIFVEETGVSEVHMVHGTSFTSKFIPSGPIWHRDLFYCYSSLLRNVSWPYPFLYQVCLFTNYYKV